MKILFVPLLLICLFSGNVSAAPDGETFANENSSLGPVFEAAPLNPEFLEYQDNLLRRIVSATEGEGPDERKYGHIPSPVDLSHLDSSNLVLSSMPLQGPYEAENSQTGMSNLVSAPAELPASYDLRLENRVTAVKNQGHTGSCWAHASLASLESTLLPSESRDFSENNMKNLLASTSPTYRESFDWDEGGNCFMAAAYLARWTGPVDECDDPYNDSSAYSPTGLPVQKHVQEMIYLPGRNGSLDNDFLKRAVMDYGAIHTSMYMDKAYYQENYSNYYCPGTVNPNHDIAIVGWNDSYDKNNFFPVPDGDGAFIIKNSWGTDWGDEGYFYISYYDAVLGYEGNAIFLGESPENYDNIYQYDPLGWGGSFGYNTSIAWGANVFTSESNETLRAVSFYTNDFNTAYEVYIYKNLTSDPINPSGPVAGGNGTFLYPGYHTHTLNTEVHLNPGERFSVVINFSNPEYKYPLSLEYPKDNYCSKAQANPEESYISSDGEEWRDVAFDITDSNLCIKAFTTSNQLPGPDWIPWNEPGSEGGRKITTAELQEVIYYWVNDLLTPEAAPVEP